MTFGPISAQHQPPLSTHSISAMSPGMRMNPQGIICTLCPTFYHITLACILATFNIHEPAKGNLRGRRREWRERTILLTIIPCAETPKCSEGFENSGQQQIGMLLLFATTRGRGRLVAQNSALTSSVRKRDIVSRDREWRGKKKS